MTILSAAARVFVAGHQGLVGSALVRALKARGFRNVMTKSHSELDLTDRHAVDEFFRAARPEIVLLAAAKVGGIEANRRFPADFLRVNLEIQSAVFESCHRHGVIKLLFLGSSCIYPKHCSQPIKEEYLLTGPLEPTNDAYAIAKIAGLVGCKSYNRQFGTRFIAAMPSNLYGPGDNFELANSHVLPALLRKFHDAKKNGGNQVELWGTGTPRRELLHVDDLAAACLFLIDHFEPTADEVFVNVGVGHDLSIRELAVLVAEIVGYSGEVVWNASVPDGTPRKLLDVSRLTALGFRPKVALRDGIAATYRWYVEQASGAGVVRGMDSAAS